MEYHWSKENTKITMAYARPDAGSGDASAGNVLRGVLVTPSCPVGPTSSCAQALLIRFDGCKHGFHAPRVGCGSWSNHNKSIVRLKWGIWWTYHGYIFTTSAVEKMPIPNSRRPRHGGITITSALPLPNSRRRERYGRKKRLLFRYDRSICFDRLRETTKSSQVKFV